MATTINIPAIVVDGVTVQPAMAWTVADASDIAALETQITALQTALDTLQASESADASAIAALQGAVAALQTQVASLRPPLTITANNQTKTYGQPFAWAGTEFTITSGVLEPGDSITSVSFSSQGSVAAAQVSATPYPILASAAVGTGLSKYNITYVAGTLTVNKAPLTVTANNESVVLGATAAITLNAGFKVAGLLNADTVTSVSLSSTGTAPGVGAGTYPIDITGVNGTGLGNYSIALVPGTLTLTAPAPTPTISPDGSTITAPTTSTLITAAGTWSFGASGQPGGSTILLNGASASGGSADKMLVYNKGQMYALNSSGQWFVWQNNSWVSTTNPQPAPPPAPAVAAAPMPASTGTLSPTFTALIASMAPNTFAEIPGTEIGVNGQDVLTPWNAITYINPNNYSFFAAAGDQLYPTYPWCGCALDTTRNRLFCGPGGGHGDCFNNSVYGFSFEDLKWRRIRDQSALNVQSGGTFTTADGAPMPQHNYNGLAVHPPTGDLYLFTGFGSPEGQGGGHIFHLDPEAQTWTQDTTGASFPSYMIQIVPSLDWMSAVGKFVTINCTAIGSFDPVTKTITAGGFGTAGELNEGTTGVDPVGNVLYYNSAQNVFKVSLTDPPNIGMNITETAAAAAVLGPIGYEWNDQAANLPLLGGCWDSKRKVLTNFSSNGAGNASVSTFDPVSFATAKYVIAAGSYMPKDFSAGPMSKKFIYWDALDIFVLFGTDVNAGIVVFKPGTSTPIVPLLNTASVTNPATTAGGTPTTTEYNNPFYAASKVAEGGTLNIIAGTFGNGLLLANGCTVNGAGGTADGSTPMPTHITGWAGDLGVGTVVPRGDNTILNNLEISGADDNDTGCSIRIQGKNLTLNNCWLHGSMFGIMGNPISPVVAGGTVIFNNSWFTDSIAGNDSPDHNIYISALAGAGGIAQFTFNGGGSLRANGQGHLIKSRAVATTISGVTALMEGSNSSRVLDVCDAGACKVSGSLFEQGPNSDNQDMIGYAREYLNNAIRFDYAGSSVSVLAATFTAAIDATTANTLDLTAAAGQALTDIPSGYQVRVTAPTGSTLPSAISTFYANNPSTPYLTWNSTGALKGTLGNAANPISLAGGVGPLTVSIYAPDPVRVNSMTVDHCTLVFDRAASSPVIVCTNSLAAAATLNGVSLPAVPITFTNCTLINRSGGPLQWTVGKGDPANNLIDGGGNTVIDNHATPGALAAAGMQPYPWMPPLPVAA